MNRTLHSTDETRQTSVPEVRSLSRDADEAALKDIEKRYHDFIPPERLAEMHAHPVQVESHEEFRKNFEERFGEAPAEGVTGWTTGTHEPAHVSSIDPGSVAEGIYHERLHQAADPETARRAGVAWHEGLTQALTERATGQSHEGESVAPYPEETERARHVAEVVGWNAIEKLYFAGDATGIGAKGEAIPQPETARSSES